MNITTELQIRSWDETTAADLDGGATLGRAEVALGPSRDGTTMTSGRSASDLWYDAGRTRSTYTTLLHVSGTLDGRRGDLTLIGEGDWDGARAAGRFRVVPGSGTGGLAGVTGTAESTSTHEDYPYYPLVLHLELP